MLDDYSHFLEKPLQMSIMCFLKSSPEICSNHSVSFSTSTHEWNSRQSIALNSDQKYCSSNESFPHCLHQISLYLCYLKKNSLEFEYCFEFVNQLQYLRFPSVSSDLTGVRSLNSSKKVDCFECRKNVRVSSQLYCTRLSYPSDTRSLADCNLYLECVLSPWTPTH